MVSRMDSNLKIAILYICTGEYNVFWKDFYISFEKFFLTSYEKHYFVFTDAKKIYNEDCYKRIHKIYQKNLGWPENTLFRYEMFFSIREYLKEFDYTFFFNANVICKDVIVGEEFLPLKEGLLVVQHPGFFDVPNYRFPYDRNKKSSAYIPYGKGQVYVCGGINGGKTNVFLDLIKELKNRIELDYKKGIIALWHDESQINKYILEHSAYKLLSPSYCYPEGWNIPFIPKLVVLDKNKFIDVSNIKKTNERNEFIIKIKRYLICKFYDLYYWFRRG
ncbi:Glycosyltransferase family 6 [Lachnospiraceae bacterium NLAE-zl-G231]|nr:Glycosyltransferase family 6 [Lachnospiraceae bacterium NLAE-zl-G231]